MTPSSLRGQVDLDVLEEARVPEGMYVAGEVLDLEEVAGLLAQVREDVVARDAAVADDVDRGDGQALGLLGDRRRERDDGLHPGGGGRGGSARAPGIGGKCPCVGARRVLSAGAGGARAGAARAAGDAGGRARGSTAVGRAEGRGACIGGGRRRPHEEEHQKHSGQDGEQASGSHRGRARATFVGQHAKARSLVAHACGSGQPGGCTSGREPDERREGERSRVRRTSRPASARNPRPAR